MASLSPYLPPTSNEAGAVFALLEVIADPATAKKALEKMVEERKAIDNATEKQQKMIADANDEARKAKAEQEKIRAEADRALSKSLTEAEAGRLALANAERRKAEAEHAARQAAEARVAVEDRMRRAEAREKELAREARELQQRETACEQLEEKQQRHEADLVSREEALAADIAETNKWLAGLKPPHRR